MTKVVVNFFIFSNCGFIRENKCMCVCVKKGYARNLTPNHSFVLLYVYDIDFKIHI